MNFRSGKKKWEWIWGPSPWKGRRAPNLQKTTKAVYSGGKGEKRQRRKPEIRKALPELKEKKVNGHVPSGEKKKRKKISFPAAANKLAGKDGKKVGQLPGGKGPSYRPSKKTRPQKKNQPKEKNPHPKHEERRRAKKRKKQKKNI